MPGYDGEMRGEWGGGSMEEWSLGMGGKGEGSVGGVRGGTMMRVVGVRTMYMCVYRVFYVCVSPQYPLYTFLHTMHTHPPPHPPPTNNPIPTPTLTRTPRSPSLKNTAAYSPLNNSPEHTNEHVLRNKQQAHSQTYMGWPLVPVVLWCSRGFR